MTVERFDLPRSSCLHVMRALLVAFIVVGSVAAAPTDDAIGANAFTKGWATFGLAIPQGVARSAVKVGSLPTQTDVKVRWIDGSIRFAVVTAKIPTAGTYPIVPTAAAQRAAPAAGPQVAVTLTVAGTPYVANLPPTRSDLWLDGPLVSESRAIVAPGNHPFLRIVFDVRSYAGGGHRVDITAENCLDVKVADQVTYDMSISINGQQVFQQAKIVHKYLSRWRKVFATGGLQESVVTPNLALFAVAHALPPFLPTIAQPRRSLAGKGVSGTGFGILGFGDLTLPMNAHSGRPELAPYPDWTAQFLVSGRPDQRAYVLRHGELAGSWGVHITEPDGTTLISIDKHPYYWLDARWVENTGPPAFDGPKNLMRGRAEPGDIAHQPSLAFVPYLVTGDRFFADEVAFWANFCLIGSFASDDNRKGPQGLLVGNEVRGIGWGLRNLADAAAYLPDASPMKAQFAAKVWNNVTALDKYAGTFQSGPLQTLFPGRRPEDGMSEYQPYMWISLWEQSYAAWAVDWAMQRGQVTAAVNFAHVGAAIRNRIARLQLNLFTHPQWPKNHDRQAPYLLAAGTWSADHKVTFFQKFADMAAATFSVPKAGASDFVRPFEGYYGPEARLLLMICEALGDVGARESIAHLMADVTNTVKMTDDLNRRSGWAIDRVHPALVTKVLTQKAPPARHVAR